MGAIVAAVRVSSAGAGGLLSPSPAKGTSGSTPLSAYFLGDKGSQGNGLGCKHLHFKL